MLRIDSPGGSTVASDVIWRELVLMRRREAREPLVASMSDLAASGGYYIAMAAPAHRRRAGDADRLDRHLRRQDRDRRLYEKLGMNIEASAIGKNAEMNSPTAPVQRAERAKLEEQLQAFYDQFVEKVAASRKMTPEAVDAIAQGRVWTGRQAKQIGLVDALGGLDRAVALAKERAKITTAEVELVVYPPRKTLYEMLTSQFGGSDERRGLAALLGPSERRAVGLAAAPWTLFRRGEAARADAVRAHPVSGKVRASKAGKPGLRPRLHGSGRHRFLDLRSEP